MTHTPPAHPWRAISPPSSAVRYRRRRFAGAFFDPLRAERTALATREVSLAFFVVFFEEEAFLEAVAFFDVLAFFELKAFLAEDAFFAGGFLEAAFFAGAFLEAAFFAGAFLEEAFLAGAAVRFVLDEAFFEDAARRFLLAFREEPFFDDPLAVVRLTNLLNRLSSSSESSNASPSRSNHSKNWSHSIGSSVPSPLKPGKSIRRMPGSLLVPVAVTRAGCPPRASTHCWISS
jgi:hypothetical protein